MTALGHEARVIQWKHGSPHHHSLHDDARRNVPEQIHVLTRIVKFHILTNNVHGLTMVLHEQLFLLRFDRFVVDE